MSAVAWVAIAPLLSRALIVEQPIEKADAIMVMSGSSAYTERTKKAAELYRNGSAHSVILTSDGGQGGWSEKEKRNPYFVELMQQELIANGVPQAVIRILPGTMRGTDDEARALKDSLDTQPISSVLIVTSPFHTRRTLSTFRRVLGDRLSIGIESTPVTSDTDLNFWWLSGEGWRNVGLEYVKLLVYWAYK